MRRLACLIFLIPVLAVADEHCAFTAQRDFDVDAVGLRTVAFASGSSDIVVEGVPGLAKVEVRGKACASDQARLAGLDVEQERSGDRLTLTPRQDRHGDWHGSGSSYAYIDVHVRVPAASGVELRGGSGDADVRNVATLDSQAGSGDLKVHAIAGSLTLELGSGDVAGGDVGSVDVRGAASGDITLDHIGGDAKVARIGSGDLRFDGVRGSVTIGRAGSGDVDIDHVDGDVVVDSIGSGDLGVDDVGGNFSLHSNGSGEVRQHNVRGTVSTPHGDD